jgi:hypothetical protein
MGMVLRVVGSACEKRAWEKREQINHRKNKEKP